MSISASNPLLRQNFGIVFLPTNDQFYPISDYFNQNITIDIDLVPPNSTCSIDGQLSDLNSKLKTLNDQIDILIDLIYHNYIYKRTKRALLLIGGKLLKALFGVETEDEMENVKKHLNILDNLIHDEKHYMISRDKLITRLAHSHHEMGLHIKTHIQESIYLFNRHEDMILNQS